ncbi:hypothetical protein [Streptomyces rugosispiralis]|uniref:WXG100 family type VII secretion target n=1 Tax=Streptomyces rugosispiralis TaxID=2967341 RepID=A0ABT1USK1_9ACTN|nr:hypothetical protein [Streptomyces rugosispiralis]MCQ8188089.1 hypothetical protein [Streptomyces rugosispiralis]
MGYFYEDFRTADFGALDTLASKWKGVHEKIKNLDDKIRDEVLKPLRDKGYWEGMAAPYAWAQIDDIQRQATAAAKVVDAVRRAIEDGAGELKAVQKRLHEAVKGFGDEGMYVGPKGEVTLSSACDVKDNLSEKDTAKVNAAQKKLNLILRDAFEADQDLSITLMDNIGLDIWFNTGKVRTDINHTSGISTDRFDAYGRELRGLDPYPAANHLTPRTLLANWVAGTGDDTYEFSQHDPLVEQLRKSESMHTIRGQTLDKWNAGHAEGTLHHRIAGQSFLGQVGTYAKDMAGLSGIDNLWGGDTNEAQSLFGSYDIDYVVKGTDPDGKLVVQYTVRNDTDMESFVPGYSKWQKVFNHDNGPGADIKERLVWTERIDPADH